MSKYEAVSKFFDETRTNAYLRAALMETGSEDDVIEVAKKFGYDFTSADVTAAKEEKYGAVDDTAMSGIAGGAGVDYTVDPMRYWGTSQWDDYWRGYPDEGERPRGRGRG